MPDSFDRRQQHLVLRRARQHQMKQLVVVLRGVVHGDSALFLLEYPPQIVDIRFGGHLRGERGDVALQQLPRLKHFKRADIA